MNAKSPSPPQPQWQRRPRIRQYGGPIPITCGVICGDEHPAPNILSIYPKGRLARHLVWKLDLFTSLSRTRYARKEVRIENSKPVGVFAGKVHSESQGQVVGPSAASFGSYFVSRSSPTTDGSCSWPFIRWKSHELSGSGYCCRTRSSMNRKSLKLVCVLLAHAILRPSESHAAASSAEATANPGRVERRVDFVREEHWAFNPPMRPEIPIVKNRAWLRNPIDAFVLARLEQQNLAP